MATKVFEENTEGHEFKTKSNLSPYFMRQGSDGNRLHTEDTSFNSVRPPMLKRPFEKCA